VPLGLTVVAADAFEEAYERSAARNNLIAREADPVAFDNLVRVGRVKPVYGVSAVADEEEHTLVALLGPISLLSDPGHGPQLEPGRPDIALAAVGLPNELDVVLSFLGGQTISHTRHLGVLEILALVALTASIGLCVYVLMPKEGFTFSLNAAGVYEALFPFADDEQEIKRRLIYWLEDFWQSNQRQIDRLNRAYFWAALALVAQLVLWSVALTTNIS
jgi:hypothetical protein